MVALGVAESGRKEALEKRIVSMFLNYNEGIGKRKVKCWREIVAYYESKYLKSELSYGNYLHRIPHALAIFGGYPFNKYNVFTKTQLFFNLFHLKPLFNDLFVTFITTFPFFL